MPRSFIIIRVSTADQAKGYSLTSQRKDLPALAQSLNSDFTKPDIYDFEVASTSNSSEMSGWSTIIEKIKQGIYDDGYMIISEVDRAHRDFGFGLSLVALLYDHNISIKTPNEELKARDLGSIITTIVKSFSAADEKRKRKSEQKRAFKEARDSGNYIFAAGRPPDGFLWNRNTKRLIHDPKRAPIIKDLLKQTELSHFQLVDYAHAKRYKTKTGTGFPLSAIKRIRNQPAYCGLMYNIQGKLIKAKNIQPLITEKLYKIIANEKLKRKPLTWSTRGKYMLVGVLKCGYCGYAMTSEVSKPNKHNRRKKCVAMLRVRAEKPEKPV